MARLLVQTTLPHSRKTSKTFVRTNGALKVSVSAHPLLELPYGRYPRLLMAWVTTEAVRTKEPVLQLGPSLSSFMFQLGLLPRGGQTGPIGRLRDQMQRLFGATIAFTWDKRTVGEWHDSGFRVSNETHLWWNPVRPEQGDRTHVAPGFYRRLRGSAQRGVQPLADIDTPSPHHHCMPFAKTALTSLSQHSPQGRGHRHSIRPGNPEKRMVPYLTSGSDGVRQMQL